MLSSHSIKRRKYFYGPPKLAASSCRGSSQILERKPPQVAFCSTHLRTNTFLWEKGWPSLLQCIYTMVQLVQSVNASNVWGWNIARWRSVQLEQWIRLVCCTSSRKKLWDQRPICMSAPRTNSPGLQDCNHVGRDHRSLIEETGRLPLSATPIVSFLIKWSLCFVWLRRDRLGETPHWSTGTEDPQIVLFPASPAGQPHQQA